MYFVINVTVGWEGSGGLKEAMKLLKKPSNWHRGRREI